MLENPKTHTDQSELTFVHQRLRYISIQYIMVHGPKYNKTLLVLLTTIFPANATIVDNTYKNLGPGQNITGTLGATIAAKSTQECALRLVEMIMSRPPCYKGLIKRHKKKSRIYYIFNNAMHYASGEQTSSHPTQASNKEFIPISIKYINVLCKCKYFCLLLHLCNVYF